MKFQGYTQNSGFRGIGVKEWLGYHFPLLLFKFSPLKTGSWTLSRLSRAAEWKVCSGSKQPFRKPYHPEGERKQVHGFPGRRSPPVSALIPHLRPDRQEAAQFCNHWPENRPCRAHSPSAILRAYGLLMPCLANGGHLEPGVIVPIPKRVAALSHSCCFYVGMWAQCCPIFSFVVTFKMIDLFLKFCLKLLPVLGNSLWTNQNMPAAAIWHFCFIMQDVTKWALS